MQNRELWNYRQMLDYWVNWLGKQDRHWTLLRMICSQYQMNWLSFIIMCARLMGRHQAEFFWTMKSMVAWHQVSKGVCNTSGSMCFTLLWWMSSLKFCIWQGTNNTHPCEPKVHLYNIRKAKGSYLLIMPLVGQMIPRHVGSQGANQKCLRPKILNIYIILLPVLCIFYYFVQFDQQMRN